jgi:xanthine dehydrogenase YagS FAD-binding subunit
VKDFEYVRAASVGQATSAATQSNAAFIAGGTNLLDLMKLEVMAPDRLVDLNKLPLDDIQELETGQVRIGALVTNSALAASHLIRKHYPVLARALLAGASAQLRNKATTAGNLLQRTRCYYFYDTAMACNKRLPGSGCSAIDGYNRHHAVLATTDACIATHPSDMAVAMRALDASVDIEKAGGQKQRIPIEDFYRLPGTAPHIEHVLEPGDLITAVTLPPPVQSRQVYRKIRDRSSFAFALVSVAAAIRVEKNRIASAALAFGGLAPIPWRDPGVEDVLVGRKPSDNLFEHACDTLLREARGRGHNDFKIKLTRRVLKAVLHETTATGTPT